MLRESCALSVRMQSLMSAPPKNPPRESRIPPEQEQKILKILGYQPGKIWTKAQKVANIFILSIETAMRLGEIVNIHREDIFLDKHYIH